MGLRIGKIYIGYRSNDPHSWKNFLLPRYYDNPRRKDLSRHPYFKYYMRWLNFFICKPRKCECCGKYMDGRGGTHIWDKDGNKILFTICARCVESKEYTDEDGWKYTGYIAWLRETWQ